MNLMDAANGAYELVGGMLQFYNCRRLYRDKQVRGVIPWLTAFFFSWGLFNLAFYPSVHSPLSTVGAGVMAAANALWLWLAWRYRRN